MTAVNLRNATVEDLKAIESLVGEAYAPARAELEDLPDVTAGFAQHLANDIVLVAETDKGIAGVIVLSPRQDALWVINLAVSPKASGKGIGRIMMTRAEEEAVRRDCREMRLRTHAGMTRTIDFYERLGWQQVERSNAAVAMRKSLTDTR